MRRSTLLVVLTVIVIVAIVITWIHLHGGIGVLQTTPTVSPLASLRVGTTMTIRTDSIFTDYYFSVLCSSLVFEKIVVVDEKGGIKPWLATEWEVKDNGMVWIFKIADNATWHDGKKLTAHDVAFSINYFMSKVPIYKRHLALIEEAKVINDYTISIKLKKPWARFLYNLAVVRIIPKHIWENVEDPFKYEGEDRNIGAGPFVYVGFDRATGVLRFKAYSNYWKGRPKIDEVVVKIYKTMDAAILALKRGDVDTIWHYARGIDPIYVPVLLENPNIHFIINPNFGVGNILWFNNKIYPYNIAEFRVAISYALSYSDYVRMIMAGYADTPNAGLVPPGWKYFKETRKLETNTSKAIEILEKLGFEDIDGDGWRELPNGTKFTMKIIVRSDIPGNVRLAELVKRDLENIGLQVKLIPVDLQTFIEIVDRKRSHECFISRTTTWGMLMWAGYGTGYIDARNIGWANVDDPELQKIVDELLVTTNEEKISELAYKLQDLYAEKLYVIPLYWDKIIQPYNAAKISGLKYSPMMGIFYKKTWVSINIIKGRE